MVIYADVLFIVNLYIDYFILLCVKGFLHLNASTKRLALGAAAGGGFSLLALLALPQPVNLLLCIAFSPLICLISFYPTSWAGVVKASASFWAFSYIFSGVILLLSQLTTGVAVVGGKPYFALSPILLFLFTALSYLVSKVVDKVRGTSEPDSLFYTIIVEDKACKAKLLAKADTGNSLKEPFSGLPVLVAEKAALKIPEESGKTFRLVPYNALSGSGLLPAFKPEKVYIKKSGKPLACYLAIYDGKLSAGSFNCLINPDALNF